MRVRLTIDVEVHDEATLRERWPDLQPGQAVTADLYKIVSEVTVKDPDCPYTVLGSVAGATIDASEPDA